MKKSKQEHLEPLARPSRKYAYDGEITAIHGDTVQVRLAGSARTIVRSVQLTDHIKDRKHVLFKGLKCKLKGLHERDGDIRGKYILTDIMPQISPSNFSHGFTPLPPSVYVSADCANKEWLITWDNIPEADYYELYWSVADDGDPAVLVGQTQLREMVVAFDQDIPPKIYFAVKSVAGLRESAYSNWATDITYLSSAPLVIFGDAQNHGDVFYVTSYWRNNEGTLEGSLDEGETWVEITEADFLPGITIEKITLPNGHYYAHQHLARMEALNGSVNISLDSGVSWTERILVIPDGWGDRTDEEVEFTQVLHRDSTVEVMAEEFDSGDLTISIQLAHAYLAGVTEVRLQGGNVITDDGTNYRIDTARGRIFLRQGGSSDADILPSSTYEIDYTYKVSRPLLIGRWQVGANWRGAAWISDNAHGTAWTGVDLLTVAQASYKPIWAAINETKMLLSTWQDDEVYLEEFDLPAIDYQGQYLFGDCTEAELDDFTCQLFPATVIDDNDLWLAYGKFRTYPGEYTDWSIVENGSLIPSSVYDMDDDGNIYHLSSPANGSDIDVFSIPAMTWDRLASDNTFQEDPSDDTYIVNFGSRNAIAFFKGDLYAIVANDKLNANTGFYAQVWKYDGVPFSWSKVWESAIRYNDHPWGLYTDGDYLVAMYSDELVYTTDGASWSGPDTIPDIWSQTNQATNLPMESTQRMGMTITPKVYGNHPIMFWALDAEMDTVPANAEYNLYKFEAGSVSILISDWGDNGDDFPNIHCADSERIWRQNGGNYEYTLDTEVDGGSVWTQPTLGHIRPMTTYGLSGYSVGLDTSTGEMYILIDGQWFKNGQLEANAGSTTYEPVGCWKIAGETYMMVIADNERVLYRRDITLPPEPPTEGIEFHHIVQSEDAGANWEVTVEDWEESYCSSLIVGPDDGSGNRKYWAQRDGDDRAFYYGINTLAAHEDPGLSLATPDALVIKEGIAAVGANATRVPMILGSGAYLSWAMLQAAAHNIKTQRITSLRWLNNCDVNLGEPTGEIPVQTNTGQTVTIPAGQPGHVLVTPGPGGGAPQWVDPPWLTEEEADDIFLTPAEADLDYATIGHVHGGGGWPFSKAVYATSQAEIEAAIAAASPGEVTIVIDCDIQLTSDIEVDKSIAFDGFVSGYAVPTLKGPTSGGSFRCFSISDAAGPVVFNNLALQSTDSDVVFSSNSSLYFNNCTIKLVDTLSGDVACIAVFVDDDRPSDVLVDIYNCQFLNDDPGDTYGYGLWLTNTDTGITDALTVRVHHSDFRVISSDIVIEEATLRLYDPVLPLGISQTASVVTGCWMDGDGNRLPEPEEIPVGTRVLNDSGSTANVGDVGYIDHTGVYKTTTTASDRRLWCVVTSGGNNGSDIYVANSGRVTVNYVGTAPSTGHFLVTSTTAGAANRQTFVSPEIFAVCQAAGSGGTVEVILLCNRITLQVESTEDVIRVSDHSGFDFTGTIAAKAGANLEYTTTGGTFEDSIKPASANELGKIVLHNTTRGTNALIKSVNLANTGTPASGTITLTATVPAGWQVGDVITTRSQTNTSTTGGGAFFVDVDLSSADNAVIHPLAVALGGEMFYQDTNAAIASARSFLRHPYKSDAASNRSGIRFPANSDTISDARFIDVSLIQRRFCISCASRAAGTATCYIRVSEIILAAP